jgi:addiction module RelE/StbE family toxin
VQLKWTDLALADLDRIETYIAADNSLLVAIDVVLRIIDTVDIILPEHPEAGRIGRVENTRELVIDGTPFLVIYRITRAVEILRVLHGAQQWPRATQKY